MKKLKDITPPEFACSVSMACPAIFEITPPEYKCPSTAPACPGLMLTDDRKRLIIVGKIVSPIEYEGLQGRIGEGEAAIEIDAELVRKALFSVKDREAAQRVATDAPPFDSERSANYDDC